MKKIILGIGLVIIIAISGGVYYVLNNLDNLVKIAIETHGSKATQTAVRVDQVKIDLGSGAAAISGLSVANSKGFNMPLAFSLGEVRAGIDLQSLQEEPYIIDEITILAPQVFVEINKDNKTNLNELKKNLMRGVPAAKPEAKLEADNKATAEPRLIIRKVIFADGNITARVAALDDKEYKLKLPSINMSNLGGSKGATPSELTREILNRLTDRASEEVKKKVIDAELDKLKATAKAKVDAEKARLKEKADEMSKEQEDKVKDKLKGLFSR